MQRITELKEIAFERNPFDGFLVFDSANLLYFTGLQGISALLVPRDGENTIFVYGVNYEQAKAGGKGFNVELIQRGDNMMKRIAEKAVSCDIKRLALDSSDVKGWRSLGGATRSRVRLRLKGELVAGLRRIKDKSELALMRKAAELTNVGMESAIAVLAPGVREYEVAAEIEYAMRRRGSGGTAFDTAVTSGPRSAFSHGGCTDREIQKGDLVVLDFGAVFENYRCDITRTLVAGKATEKQKRICEIVKRAHQAAFETAKALVKAQAVDAVARRIIEDAGHGELFVHGLGHGVGLEVHEPPILNSTSTDVLAAGNVVTIEPGIYIPGFGGVRIEDTVLVEKDKAEKLTEAQYSL